MSFPRAKIQRFNDAKGCAPPPGSYDPKFAAKVKGAVIEKSERFLEPKCPLQSTNSAESPANLSLSSSSSKSTNTNCNCLPVFRTPQLPRKHVKLINSAPHVKTKLKFDLAQKNSATKEVDPELYDELMVDRDNKDATIKENEMLIDELYERIRNLEKELQDLQTEKETLVEKHATELQEKDKESIEKLAAQSKELNEMLQVLEVSKCSLEEVKVARQVLEKLVSEKELLLLSHKQNEDDMMSEINKLKEKEAELNSKHVLEVQEWNVLCKKLEDDKADLKKRDEMRMDLEEEIKNLKESLVILSDKNSDLDSKLNQKQQMILLLQSELSSAGLELEEGKSEHEKAVADLIEEKSALIEKVGELRIQIKERERLLVMEYEMRAQEIQTLQENIFNSSVVRENLETNISDKESALVTLSSKYEALEAVYKEACEKETSLQEELQQKVDILKQEYEERMSELQVKASEKEEEIEMRLKAVSDKYCALEAEYEKTCLEHNLVMEAHRLEMDEIRQKYEEDVSEARMMAEEKEKELERTLQEIMDISVAEVEVKVMEVKIEAETKLKEVENSWDRQLKDHTTETAKKLKDCENKMEMKLKESEQKIHQLSEEAYRTDEELRKMTHLRDELRISNMEHQLSIVDLQDKVDTLVTELNTTNEKHEAELGAARTEGIMARKECKKLKIVNNTIKDSLEALRKRLLESESDVEQLTQSLEQVIAQKTAAEDQVLVLSQELETTKDSMNHLAQETVKQIEDVRTGLLRMLEEFRKKAEKNVTAKEEEILEHRHKIEELSARIFELSETLSASEETNSEHEREIEALTEKLDHQRECAQIATQQISSLEASNAIYQHQIQAMTSELEYQKDFSHKASDHISALAGVKSNQEREICDLLKELNAERSKVAKLSKDIDELKDSFDCYKKEICCVIENYNHELQSKGLEIETKNKDLSKINCDLRKVSGTVVELESVRASMEKELVEHKVKIEELSSEVEGLKQTQNSALQAKLCENQEYYQSLLDKAEAKTALADHWENTCKELEALIGPFREQLETFESERKALELRKEAAEEEVRKLGLKYAEILGHQNHKQKIKHLIKLKEQNLELSKEVERLAAQVKAQSRVIDRLKSEQQRTTTVRKPILQHHNPSSTKGKENAENKDPLPSAKVKPLRSYR